MVEYFDRYYDEGVEPSEPKSQNNSGKISKKTRWLCLNVKKHKSRQKLLLNERNLNNERKCPECEQTMTAVKGRFCL